MFLTFSMPPSIDLDWILNLDKILDASSERFPDLHIVKTSLLKLSFWINFKSDSWFKWLKGIEIYTGEGKGKSTSALGKALQAIGKGISQDKSHRVLILQWLKGGSGYTEDAAIEALRESYPHLVDHLRSGRDAIVWRGQQQPIDYVEAERAWEIAKAAILSGLYKTIILDELNPTVDLELLPVESIHQTLLKKPADTEVVITGRCKNEPSYFELANVYSEMVCHKHYANVGVDLKRGVDY